MDSKNQIQKREIKFRAWDKETGKMHYVVNKPRTEENVDDELIIQFSCTGYSARTNKKYIGDECLMQYTGLFDKNGKRIFEGDVLRVEQSPYGTYFGEVKWINFSWRFVYRSPYSGENQEQFLGVTGCREVIGNIFENPELLEAKND